MFYQQAFDESFTDDASVVEKLGYIINLVEGNIENIKITSPIDIDLAEILIKHKHLTVLLNIGFLSQ